MKKCLIEVNLGLRRVVRSQHYFAVIIGRVLSSRRVGRSRYLLCAFVNIFICKYKYDNVNTKMRTCKYKYVVANT